MALRSSLTSRSRKKLLLTNWTGVQYVAKQKHFGVSRVNQPEGPTALIERVEIEVVFSKAVKEIARQ